MIITKYISVAILLLLANFDYSGYGAIGKFTANIDKSLGQDINIF
jgi:hypothetical protein